ncbi:MAG: NAD(P)H-dependent oxidoreductase [Clostridia bacterium]|nr:NAD(P)H-dependent oxidoreductase [Clostridia bacterium]
MNILFVNACVRKNSRTRLLAERVLSLLEGTVTEVKPATVTEPIVSEEFITNRSNATAKGVFDDPAYIPACQFAQADLIVVAAPYWDLSFPAVLKAYFEQINVLGVTFEYTEDGNPRGLCRAKKLIYVTTAGGPIISDAYGYGYVKALAQYFYGISDVCQFKAEGLDVIGADVQKILDEALKKGPIDCRC